MHLCDLPVRDPELKTHHVPGDVALMSSLEETGWAESQASLHAALHSEPQRPCSQGLEQLLLGRKSVWSFILLSKHVIK